MVWAWQCCLKNKNAALTIPSFLGPTVGTIVESTPQLRAVYALSQARKHRHHRDCFCRMFDKQFCNAADALWQAKLNRELDLIKR